MQFEDEIANISRVSLVTPVRRFGAIPPSASGICTLIAHGLGSDNPKNKSHLLDSWVDLIGRGIRATEKKDATFISYTARGHGDSNGWEDSASDNPDQFTWRHLYTDMVAVAEFYQIPKFIASGSSMGSATSLYAAMKAPDRIRAVIMVRPPTAWKERLARRKFLLASAKKCQEAEIPGEKFHFVLRGAALSDLPDLESEIDLYRAVVCPVLILTVEGDDSHPVSTAIALHNVLQTSILHVAADKKSAMRDWPDVIADFLLSLP